MTRMQLGVAVGAAMIVTGCGEEFLSEEMAVGDADKVRPITVVAEPPEVSPGDTVRVSVVWHQPGDRSPDLEWRVALQTADGLYESDPVERDYVNLDDRTSPVEDLGDGFRRQRATYVVPLTVLEESPSLDALGRGGELDELAATVDPDFRAGDDPRPVIDDALAELTPEIVRQLDASDQAEVMAIADLFATRIRFRITMTHDIHLDVTRNVTVRHSARLESSNLNENPSPDALHVIAVAPGEEPPEARATRRVPLGDPGTVVTIPWRSDRTYYLALEGTRDRYGSPFSSSTFEEPLFYRWYWVSIAGRGDTNVFFVNDDGDETEMDDLDGRVRVRADAGDRVRIMTVIGDERPEWERYAFSPGLSLVDVEVRFEAE